MQNDNIEIVEKYLDALRQKDLSSAPFAAEVQFQNPMTGPGTGADNLRALLSAFLPAMEEVRTVRHVSEGEYVTTLWEVHGVFGIIPILELFRIEDGQIAEAKAFFDPRPVLGRQ
jgi:limonene-1,2-epoxide hydrolase